MAANRQAIRAAFAALLTGALAGPEGLAHTVYDHLPADFGGASPVIAVGARGSKRARLTFRGGQTTFLFDVFVFVLAASTDGSWTERDAENALDALELAIAEALEGNQNTAAAWISADVGETECDFVTIGGQEYRRERLPVALVVAS
jgi:hypothetical protein